MKKQLLLTTVFLLLCIATNAANRKWDFTNWSSATIANLASDLSQNSDAGWSDDERGNGTRQNGNCYWWVPAGVASMHTTVDGKEITIPELDGLDFAGYKARSLAIAINYPSTSIGTYAGGSYLWLGSKSQSFTIPAVKPGAKIIMDVESHKSTDGRGVGLTVNGTSITISEGSEKPTAKTTCSWIIPDTIEGETVDVKVTNNNGCHLYKIEVWENGSEVEESKKVAYIYNSTGYDENSDNAWLSINGMTGAELTQIDIANGAADVTLDSLQSGYDAVVISPYVNATDAYVSTLKSAIAYEPVINLNPQLYSAWGYGNVAESETSSIQVTDTLNALFEDENVAGYVNEDKTIEWLADGTVTGVQLGSYFADDDTLAVAGAAVAIHTHNALRNAYMFMPYGSEDIPNVNGDVAAAILPAAILNVADTKKSVTAVTTPSITEEYANKQTTVAIACGNSKAVVYYTTDGTEPTSASTVYTEPLVMTSADTVKAIAYADGYLPSAVATLIVTIKEQASAPVISVSQESGKSIVTIDGNSTDSTNVVYYNYSGSTETAESSKYSEPIEITSPVTITAFAIGDKTIASEVVSKYIDVKDAALRLDILTTFDANRTDWSNPYDSTGTAKATYLFSWGKKARSMYDTTQPGTTQTVYGEDGQPLKNVEGNDSTVTTYPEMAAETLTGNNGEWIAESQGQVLDWENTAPKFNIGDNSNYNPATAEDIINANDTIGITSFFLNFGAKVSGEPYNARLRTAKAYAGPFDIVVYAGQGNGSNVPQMEIQTSKDGETWDSIAMVNIPATKRMWARTKVSYEGSDAVYVRVAYVGGGTKGHIYNVYLLNAGEHTQEYITGIVDVDNDGVKGATATAIYDLNGVRLNTMKSGVNIVRYSDGTVKKVMKK